MANSYNVTHNTYGKSIDAVVTDDSVTYYWIHNNELLVGTYNRRTTQTTYHTESLPKSLY